MFAGLATDLRRKLRASVASPELTKAIRATCSGPPYLCTAQFHQLLSFIDGLGSLCPRVRKGGGVGTLLCRLRTERGCVLKCVPSISGELSVSLPVASPQAPHIKTTPASRRRGGV